MKSITELRQQREELQKAIGAYMHELSNWDAHIEKIRREGYQKGLEDAWELARRIKAHPEQGGMSLDELIECFGNVAEISVLKVPVSEAKAKYDAWKAKKEQDEIKVGDVVYWNTLYEKMIVIKKVDDRYGLIHLSDGSFDTSDGCYLLKTGEHYDLPWLKECQ